MKSALIILIITAVTATFCHAQQTRPTDDALLLEYYQSQRYAEALTYLKSTYTEPVTDTKELSRLAYSANMARMLPEAEGYYQRIYETDSSNVSVLFNLANINQRRGNNPKAELYFKKLVALDTLNFNSHNRLGQIYKLKGENKIAAGYFEKANKINPADADVATDLSDVYIALKEPVKADMVLNVAIEADPQNILLLQALLRLNYLESKWKETVKTGEQLTLLGDSTTFTLSKLGIGYFFAKNYQCGISTLSDIPETDQSEISAYYVGACYKLLKDPKKAITYFKKAIKLSTSQGTANYFNEVADSYETIGSFAKAKENYQKGLLYEEKPITYYYLAAMYDTKLKDKNTALKYYKKYIATDTEEKEKKYKAYSIARVTELTTKNLLTIQ